MNSSSLVGKNQQTILSGANTLGLISLLAYVIRSFNEVNQNMEEIRTEFSTLKNYINENTKRANISFNRLNQKIEETSENYKRNSEHIEKQAVDLVRHQPVEDHKTDDITSAINSLMG